MQSAVPAIDGQKRVSLLAEIDDFYFTSAGVTFSATGTILMLRA